MNSSEKRWSYIFNKEFLDEFYFACEGTSFYKKYLCEKRDSVSIYDDVLEITNRKALDLPVETSLMLWHGYLIEDFANDNYLKIDEFIGKEEIIKLSRKYNHSVLDGPFVVWAACFASLRKLLQRNQTRTLTYCLSKA